MAQTNWNHFHKLIAILLSATIGVTGAASEDCTLTGGEVVQSGWSGKDTGSNHCNSCSCSDGGLECTEMGCMPLDESVSSTTATTTIAKTCKLTGGEVVQSGWAGKDTGSNYCNSCSCSNGMMACTRMLCPPSTAGPTAVTTTKAGSVKAMCTLSDGATKVADGWSGKDTGDNYCNSCRCSDGALACTEMGCVPASSTTATTTTAKMCTLTGGEFVPSGWSGKDTGDNYCNSCTCGNGMMACTLMMCPPSTSTVTTTTTAKMCKLTGGEVVPSGWSGKDTGDNYCNSCKCGNGMMACTMMMCPPSTSTGETTTVTTTKSVSENATCTLGDGLTKVAVGWSGKDAGANYCNSCRCSNRGLACTKMLCERRSTTTAAGNTCTLSGGEVVQSGWSGKDTGSNHCNSCSCSDGGLECTEMGCMPLDESVSSTTATTTIAKTCKLTGGEVVQSGWAGKDTGSSYCNSCSCSNGMMACTRMLCPPSTAGPTAVTTTKAGSVKAMCTLSDGATKVADGWSGKDTGDNYCNSCRCSDGALACTEMGCVPASSTTATTTTAKMCKLTGGEFVPSGWSGKDTGDNYCNSCTCGNGMMACTMIGCPPTTSTMATTSTAKMCKLTGGEFVPSGWSGKDTGDNYCNSCTCGNGMMACTMIGCPPSTSTMATTSTAKMCKLTGGEVVPSGWSGKDTGDNYCNSCTCGNGMMACTLIGCPPKVIAETTTSTTTKAASMNAMCTLSDGITKVAAGWSGKDLGSNWCNSCSCTERGAMICTMMFCVDDLQVVQV